MKGIPQPRRTSLGHWYLTKHPWHVTIWQDASIAKAKVTVAAIKVVVMTDGDTDDRAHVPTGQLATLPHCHTATLPHCHTATLPHYPLDSSLPASASGFTFATHCTGLGANAMQIWQNIPKNLHNFVQGGLYCIAILAKVCGALGRGWYVLVIRNYTQWGGIMQRDRCA